MVSPIADPFPAAPRCEADGTVMRRVIGVPQVTYPGGRAKFHDTTVGELDAVESAYYDSLPPAERAKFEQISTGELDARRDQARKDRRDRDAAATERAKQATLREWQDGIRSGRFDPHGTVL